jgi:V/A-type H+-transporting ATPase subunit F
MNIVALCDKDTAMGLRLAGILDVRIPDNNHQSAIHLWNQIEEEHTDIGLIIITEEIAETIGKQLSQFRLRNLLPIIVEIPDKNGRKKDHLDYVSQLIKKAVGMELKK